MPLQGSPLSSVQGQAGTPHPSQEHDGGGEQGAAGGEKQPRKKARIKWITFATGTGFKAARSLLEDLARRECDGLRLGPRGDTTSTHQEIQYTFSCSYRKKPWCCQWRCKVCITRKTISAATYASVSVEDGDRDAEHMDDAFEILVPADGTLAHSDHTVSNERGTHPLFVASARTCPEMLGWDRTAISRWIMQNHIAPSFFLSLTHKHTYVRTSPHTHTHTHTHFFPLCLSHTHTRSFSLAHTQTQERL